jgi:hypothetical protein
VAGVEYDVVSTAEVVLADLLEQTGSPASVTRGQVTTLLSYLIYSSQMQLGSLRERVDSLFARWLRHPRSFGSDPRPSPYIQRISYVERLSSLIADAVLDLENDREPLERFLRWLDVWEAKWKQRASPILDDLKNRYPAPDLWDIVRLEE